MDVGAPAPVALFQSKGVEGPHSRRRYPFILTRFEEQVPHRQPELIGEVEFPTEFAGVGDPDRQGPGVADIDPARREVGEGLVRKIGRADFRQDLARSRPPQTHRRVGVGEVDNGHAVAAGRSPDPVEVAGPGAFAHKHPEPIRAESGDRQVTANAGALGQPGRVDNFSRENVHPVGGKRVDESEGVGTGHFDDGKTGEVEKPHAFPGCEMFDPLQRGPVHRRPATSLRDQLPMLVKSIGVRFEPVGQLEPCKSREDRPHLLVAAVQG